MGDYCNRRRVSHRFRCLAAMTRALVIIITRVQREQCCQLCELPLPPLSNCTTPSLSQARSKWSAVRALPAHKFDPIGTHSATYY